MPNEITSIIKNCEHAYSPFQVIYSRDIDGEYKCTENTLCGDCLKKVFELIRFNVDGLVRFDVKYTPENK